MEGRRWAGRRGAGCAGSCRGGGLRAAVSAWQLGKAHRTPQNQEGRANADGKGEKDPSPHDDSHVSLEGSSQSGGPRLLLPSWGQLPLHPLSELGRANVACASEPCPLEHACSRFPTKNDVTSAAVLLSKESDEGEKESPVHSSVGQGGHTWPRGRTPH